MSPASAERIAFLDHLRIFAFLSVLVGHKFYPLVAGVAADTSVHGTLRLVAALVAQLCHGGGAGVVVFFLVSGYVVTHVLRTQSASVFAIRRLFRIYPLYIVAVLIQYTPSVIRSGTWPSPSVLVPQLLLVGDVFGTPYTLGGVEWTLRVEVVFYAVMAALRHFGVMNAPSRLVLPGCFVLATVVLGFLAPIPSATSWNRGVLTTYMPFLFLGAMFYLHEQGRAGWALLSGFVVLVFSRYFVVMARLHPQWNSDHFAALSVLIFAVLWTARRHLVATPAVLAVSDLTYSVYLFHAWLLDHLRLLAGSWPAPVPAEVSALVGLGLVSWLMLTFVERPANRLGRAVTAGLHGWRHPAVSPGQGAVKVGS